MPTTETLLRVTGIGLAGISIVGCATPAIVELRQQNTASRFPENAYPTEEARQKAILDYAINQQMNLTGIAKPKTINIRMHNMEVINGLGATNRMNAYTPSELLDGDIFIPEGSPEETMAHELRHIIQSALFKGKKTSPLLQQERFIEGDAQIAAVLMNPRFEKQYYSITNEGSTMLYSPLIAVPNFDQIRPSPEMNAKEMSDFKIGIQVMLYHASMKNWLKYYKNFPSLYDGVQKVSQGLAKSPDKAEEVLQQVAGYKTHEEFITDNPFFGAIVEGPRIMSARLQGGSVLVYYFYLHANGDIQPLTGVVDFKSENKKHIGNTYIKGIGYIYPNTKGKYSIQSNFKASNGHVVHERTNIDVIEVR